MRTFLEKISGARPAVHRARKTLNDLKLKLLGPNRVFKHIYKTNYWRDKQSISGPGSNSQQTQTIVRELPGLFQELQIQSILDIPCGDFHWMKDVPRDRINYVGGDIVAELIQQNKRFESDRTKFHSLNLLSDRLPRADLVLCRDCLVHFSYRDIFKALQNICLSESRYLLTTSFPDRAANENIVTGRWRPLNLQKAPFSLPMPLRILNERCTEANNQFADKSLCLWEVAQTREAIATARLDKRNALRNA